MNIGILGAGMIGANLARLLVRAGHTITLANSREPHTISELVADIGATAATAVDAVKSANLIVVSVPQGAIERLSNGLFDNVPDDVIVIDTGNYYPGLRDQRIPAIEAGLPESVWTAQQLRRPVIKAFNSISFTSLANGGRLGGDQKRIALPVAGDDGQAKAIVMELIEVIGFDGVDAGPLAESWRQQPGTPTYCTDLDRAGVIRALALADRASAPGLRDQFIAQMLGAFRQGEAIDLLALSRTIYAAPRSAGGQ